jgi:HSP20 family molecular chaperone IbpA
MTVKKGDIKKNEVEVDKGIDRISSARVFTPAVDIIEHPNDIVLIADMPGVDETSVDLTLEKNLLTIHGHVEDKIPDKYNLIISEYGLGDYERTFKLSDEIDREKIHASVKDGVLRLVLPKAEKAKAKKITVTGQA